MSDQTQDTYTELIKKIQNSQGVERKDAFNVLIDQFYFAAYAWASKHLEDPEAAQDAVQDAFLVAYQKIDNLQKAEAFPSWMQRLVMTQCYRQIRRAPNTVVLDDNLLRAPSDVVSEVEQRFLHKRLLKAVSNLPQHERIVTKLYYLDGFSQQEVAVQLDLPLTTIKKRLQRARERLRETMPMSRLLLRAA